jgi:hypothetical protein
MINTPSVFFRTKLPRRPAELAATDDMQMEVVDGLAGVGPVVDDDAEAALKPLLRRHGVGREHQPPQQQRVLLPRPASARGRVPVRRGRQAAGSLAPAHAESIGSGLRGMTR